MKIHPLVIVNLFICIVALIAFATLDVVFLIIGIIAFLVSIVGLFLLTSENYKAGFWIYVISMIMFISASTFISP